MCLKIETWHESKKRLLFMQNIIMVAKTLALFTVC